MPRALSVALFLAPLLVAACGHSHDEPVGVPSGATCPATQTLTYDNFGKAFMQTYCIRCHSSTLSGAARQGATADHDFDKIELIRVFLDHIDQKAGAGPASTNTSMPPSDPKPTNDERRKLAEWVACGAP